jgi:hypothetical protein
MGRHSAASGDEDEPVLVTPVVVDRPRPGRHSRSDEERAGAADPAAQPGPKPRPAQDRDEPVEARDEPAETEAVDVPFADQQTERIGLLEVAMAAEADAEIAPVAEPAPIPPEGPTPGPAEPEAAEPTESVAPPEPAPVQTPKPAKEPKEAKAPKPPRAARIGRGTQSTSADLAILREHSDVRARVIAAIVAPFVLYTAVLFLIGAMDVYLIWIWVPLVTAGVLAGSILDAAHRRGRAATDSPPPPDA